MTQETWARALTEETFDAAELDGHFVALRWRSETLDCYTDQLGLRTLYFSRHGGGVCISTRMDWIAQTFAGAEIDFEALGSRWLLFNQLSYASCVTGIDRLGPGGWATFRNGQIISSRIRPWLPSFEPSDSNNARDVLESILGCAFDHPRPASLSLSGGLDSRLLLALMALRGDGKFATHSIGDPADPDVSLARRISQATAVHCRHFNDPLPDAAACVSAMRAFSAQSMVTEPCTSYGKLRYYSSLRRDCGMMVDGGFGEIARRQYLNRLTTLGRSAIETLDYARILELMRSPRSEMFSGDVARSMQTGAFRDLHDALAEMPTVQSLGPDNFMDLLSIRTRVPNFGGPEQARIDGEILNLIPCVQASFLRIVLGMPVNIRKNSRFHYDTIRNAMPFLGNLPLAKSGVTYPFGLPSNLSWLIVKAKRTIGLGYSDPGPDHLLGHIREYVLDRIHSSEVTSDPTYDYSALLQAVSAYYEGEHTCRRTVDWWFAFDFWRMSLSRRMLEPNQDS